MQFSISSSLTALRDDLQTYKLMPRPHPNYHLLCIGLIISALLASIAFGQQLSANDRLVQAAQSGDVQGILAALRAGASVNEPGRVADGPRPQLALPVAVTGRHNEAIKLLLESGADPTPAIDNAICQPAIVKELLDHGADPNYGRGMRTSPLTGTVVRGNGELESLCIQSAQLLIEHGAKIDGIGDGHPALTEAVELNAPRFIELFLGKGANINVVDGVGLTPLLEAISRYALESDCLRKHASPCEHMPTIELLLQRGADPNFRNADKWSELFDDHFPDLTGYTALGLCARYGWYDLAKLLLEHGADPTIPRNDGSLPVTIATAHQHAKVAALIGRYTGSNHSR